MKQVIIIIILITILLSISCYTNMYLTASAQTMSTHTKNIQIFTQVSDWNNTNNELLLVKQNWHAIRDKWAILIDHREIDYIEQSLAKLSKYIASKNVSDILAESENLFTLVDHIPEIEYVALKNIF